MERSHTEKDLRMLLDEKWNINQKHANFQAIKPTICWTKEVILPICTAIMTFHLQGCAQLWSPQHKWGMELLEWVQGEEAVRMIRWLWRDSLSGSMVIGQGVMDLNKNRVNWNES